MNFVFIYTVGHATSVKSCDNYICAIAICIRACMWQIMLLLVTELKIQVADGAWMVRRQQLSNYSSKQRVSDSPAGTTESRLDR